MTTSVETTIRDLTRSLQSALTRSRLATEVAEKAEQLVRRVQSEADDEVSMTSSQSPSGTTQIRTDEKGAELLRSRADWYGASIKEQEG